MPINYPLSIIYQQEIDQGVIPCLVGSQCKQHEENQREDYALWHLVLSGLARCPGTGCCCEVKIFKHLLMPKQLFSSPRTSLPSLAHSCRPAWIIRLQGLNGLSEQGHAKLKAAQRTASIFDTSLVKQWTPEPTKPQNAELPCNHAASQQEQTENTLPCHHAADIDHLPKAQQPAVKA